MLCTNKAFHIGLSLLLHVFAFVSIFKNIMLEGDNLTLGCGLFFFLFPLQISIDCKLSVRLSSLTHSLEKSTSKFYNSSELFS